MAAPIPAEEAAKEQPVLKRLYIDNVRCFQGFEFRPGPVSVVVGPNGGGKSTIFDVLQAVQGFLGTAGNPVSHYFGLASLTRWDRRLTQTIEMEVETGQRHYLYQLQVHHDRSKRDASIEERLSVEGKDLYRLTNGEVQLFGDLPTTVPRTSFPADRRRSFISILEPRPDNTLITAFRRWLAGMWLFRLRPDLIQSTTASESTSVAASGSDFASWYRTLQQETPAVMVPLWHDLQPVIPGMQSIRLQRIDKDAKLLVIDCLIDGTKFELFLEDCSDGQRALLVLYTILHALSGHATFLAFDEPDNFVSQAEIQPWLSALRDNVSANGSGTLMVMSHHPEVIDYLAPDQIVQIWRDSGSSRLRVFEPDLASGLPASDQLRLRNG